MKIQIDDTLTVEVYFHILDREEGYDDDIRVRLSDSGPPGVRIFEANSIGFLLTPDQAEQLAAGLMQAAEQSRATPSW